MAQSLGTATGRIIIDSSGVTQGLGRAESGLAGFSKRALALGGLGTGLAMAFKGAVSTAMDFDAQLSQLGAVADATAPQMQALRKQALDLGAATRYSATESAVAQTELAKAGLTAQQILGGGLQSALALAAAGNLDLGQAAGIAANSMKQFKMSAGELPGIADALATAANVTTADVKDFGDALAQAGSVGKSAGLGFRDVLVFLTALAENSVKGSDAGTSLKSAMVALLSPTKQAEQAMRRTGLSVLDSNGNMVDAVTLSGRLAKATEGMTRAQRTAYFDTLVGRDGIRALNAVLDQGQRKLRDHEKALGEHGTAAQVAAKMQDNLRGDIEQLGGAFETLQITVASAATPALRGFVQGLTDLITGAGDNQPLQDLGQGLMQVGQAGMTAIGVLAPLAQGVATLGVGALGVVGQLAGFAAGLTQTTAGQAALTAALYGGAAAWAAYRVAAAAGGAMAVAGNAAAFLSLARGVRSGAEAMTIASAVAPRLGMALTALTGPVGILIAGVGLFAGAVAVLKSGFFSGGSAAQAYAQMMDRVKQSADAAKTSVQGLKDAVSDVKDARLAQQSAALAVERGERNLAQAVKTHGRGSLEAKEAANGLAIARRSLTKATQDVGDKTNTANKAARANITTQKDAIQKTRDAIDANNRMIGGLERFGGGTDQARRRIQELIATNDGLKRQLAGQEQGLKGAATGFRQVADAAGKAPAKANAAGKALRDVDKTPVTLAKATTGITKATEKSKQTVTTGAAQIRAVLPTADAAVDMSAFNSSIAAGMARALGTIQDGVARARAALASINPSKRMSPSPNDRIKQGLNDTHRAVDQGLAVTVKTAKDRAAEMRKAVEGVIPAASKKDRLAFAPITRAATSGAEKVMAQAKKEAQDSADYTLGIREALDRALAMIDQRAENRRMAQERARLVRERNDAQARLRKAKAADRPQARRDITAANLALSNWQSQTKQDLLRRQVEAKSQQAQQVSDLIDQAGQGLDRVATAITDSVQRALQGQVQAMEQAFDAAVTAAEAGFTAAVAAAQGRLDAAINEINQSADARRADAAQAEADAIRAARVVEDTTDKRQPLQEAAARTQGRAEQLAGVLQRARTESERKAAEELLALARKDAETAARELRGFDEDQRATQLEAEAKHLQDTLEVRRQAAQREHDDTMAAAQRTLDAQRQAAQAQLDAQRQAAEQAAAQRIQDMERQFGDLRESLRTQAAQGKIDQGKFLEDVAGITRGFAPELQASGNLLGLAFSRGLDRAQAEVRRAANSLASVAAQYLRLRSPAERGPLSEDSTLWGQTLARGFADGMASQAMRVRMEADRLALAAKINTTSGQAMTQGPAGRVIHQTINVTAERPLEDARLLGERLAWHARTAGGV